MPEKQYFEGIDIKSGSTVINSVDVADSEARADLADLKDYVEGIAPVSLSVTENGTYTAPTGVFGYSPVSVSVPTGAEIIARDAWNALTTAQKRAKGLVAIQDTTTGYDRGVLVNGADYIQKNIYIPYSNEDDVLCEAYVDNFDATADTWGTGNNPLLYADNTKKPVYNSTENAILVNTATDNVIPYFDAVNNNTPITIYAVTKATVSGQYKRFISNATQDGWGYSSVVCQTNNGGNVLVSTYGNDTAVNVSSAEYFAMAIKLSVSSVDFFIGNEAKINKSIYAISRYTVLGKFTLSGTSNQYPGDNYFRYFAVVAGNDSDTTITNNLNYLQEQLIGE